MSEWNSVLVVCWILWAVDGLRLGPRRAFHVVRRWGALRGRNNYGRWTWIGAWPGKWRSTTSDLPLALSPVGICNRPAGSAGRPAEGPSLAQAWRWEEVRDVGLSNGWLFVNGSRFCPDTGHLTARQLLELARLTSPAREQHIRVWLRLLVRPAHLRRRVRVLIGRTETPAILNTLSLVLFVGLSVYLFADGASRLPAMWTITFARFLPLLLGGMFLLHVSALGTAWSAARRLKPVAMEHRRSALLGALLLPPQGLRLRAAVGEGFFPAQHPLSAVLAFGDEGDIERLAFQTLADLRWPIGEQADSTLAREVTKWFRTTLEATLLPRLKAVAMMPERLLAPPKSDAPESCAYCPRCGDQFRAGPSTCPHGIELVPLLHVQGPTTSSKT